MNGILFVIQVATLMTWVIVLFSAMGIIAQMTDSYTPVEEQFQILPSVKGEQP